MLSFSQRKYYFFGVKAGLANFFRNGWKLGLKKTLGKIFQPVNFYGRFPEYYFFEQGLEPLWKRAPAGKEIRILDIGSPKLFGMYLAFHYPVEVWLTDIHPLNIDEYRVLWGALAKDAAGAIHFDLQDARRLSFPDQMFDGVYAMSVIEHIAGDTGDSSACAEMLRVLRPGGRLALSVPFGLLPLEQRICGLKNAVEKTRESQPHFFQRIYDERLFLDRVSRPLHPHLAGERSITVFRRRLFLVKMIHWLRERLGEDVMGFLGFTNPLQSMLCNGAEPGFKKDFYAIYGPVFRLRHVYADLVWTAEKDHPGSPSAH